MRFAALLGISLTLTPQVRIGQPAPELKVGGVIQGKLDHATLPRAQLIEFWATWCLPCLESLPHLNELAEQFKDREIDFISLTAEDRATVESYLKSHPIGGIVALDPASIMANRYGVLGIPVTVLIDRSGRVVRVLQPDQVTAAVLDDLVMDRPVNLSAIQHGVSRFYPMLTHPAEYYMSASGESKAVVRMEIGISNTVGGSWNAIAGQIQGRGASLPELLAFAYELPLHQIEVSKYFQGGGYDVEGWVPTEHAELLKPLLRLALEAAIDYHPRMEKRRLDVKGERKLVDFLVIEPSTSDTRRPF